MQRVSAEGQGKRRGHIAPAARPSAPRVVLVDDIESVRDSLAALLRTAGYSVTAVESGPALEIWLGQKPWTTVG